MDSLYKSEQGKKEILSLYDEKLASLNIDFDYKEVDTQYGKTNVIINGNPANPPLIVLHGSNACAPIALEVYPDLNKKFQVFAIDALAQPNKSDGTLLSMKDDSYGKWMQEMITKLEIQNITMVGFSLGGLMILKTLEFDESKIKEVYLCAPAYIVNGNPLKALWKIFIPMKKYIKTKNTKYVEKFLAELFSEKDEFAVRFLSKVFLHFNMDFSPVPTISKQKAQLIKTPITLIAAKKDILFPGEKMIQKAKKIFPSLQNHVLLQNSKHVQSKEDNQAIERIILKNNIYLE